MNADGIEDEEFEICSGIAGRVKIASSINQGKRDYQEDAYQWWENVDENITFVVVADGAGGHGGGAEASCAAVETAERLWKENIDQAIESPERFLDEWMSQAHAKVNKVGAEIHHSARAVVVACIIKDREAFWVHAGDSRLIRFEQGEFVERTRDDSVVQVLYETGSITEEEMGTHPDQNRLLQSLGGDDEPKARHGRADLECGDSMILCSDGFWEHLEQSELEELVEVSPGERRKALDHAVKKAVKRGGDDADNTTAVVIYYESDVGQSANLWCKVLAAVLILSAIALTVWWLMMQGYVWENMKPWQSPKDPSQP